MIPRLLLLIILCAMFVSGCGNSYNTFLSEKDGKLILQTESTTPRYASQPVPKHGLMPNSYYEIKELRKSIKTFRDE